jgi:hypothetical protein
VALGKRPFILSPVVEKTHGRKGMKGLTQYISRCDWEEVITYWYVLVDDTYKALYGRERIRERGPQPKFSDSEVITVALVCDTLFKGKEVVGLAFIRQYHKDMFPNLLEESRFNRRRRGLATLMERMRRKISGELIDPRDRLRLVDTAPIPVCTYMRSRRCRSVQGKEYVGVMPSKRAMLYGFRIHLTSSLDMVVDDWTLAPAGIREVDVVEDLLVEHYDLTLPADKGYTSYKLEEKLKRDRGITLLVPPQKGHRRVWPKRLKAVATRYRRLMETTLSVLATVFHLEQPGSRSISGLIARTATKLLAYTLSFSTARALLPQEN